MAGKKRSRRTKKKTSPVGSVGSAPYKSPPETDSRSFPIVGIGASAGGLESLETLFKAMPANTGIGFVVVVHLDPTHISILPELLQKHTKMPVCQIEDGTRVKPDHVYVIPPNRDLSILRGTLQLMELAHPRGSKLPIDSFLRSLALDQERNGICIVLSGTGTDGTLGVKAIKGGVGMVMVQDEESAKYDGMPRSAIATGLVDYVLSPDMMPAQLLRYTRHATQTVAPVVTPAEGPIPQALQKIFVILRARAGHDFSLYKKNTICRRIERRLNVHQIDNISDYVRYLQEDDREASVLFKELLIGVTNFFRDPEAFQILEAEILPKLLASKPDDYAIRAWVPGCASGEEAYSVAIALHECMERIGRHFHVQIFGTDIDESAIAVARAGIYPESIVGDVGPERIGRYFSKDNDGQYRVKKLIREMLVFAPQNVIKDPPFTKLDLLCCRNLLIYLGVELQRKLLPVFHYSLRPGGVLFLGSSETIGVSSELFAPLHRKWKIFRRAPPAAGTSVELDFPIQSGSVRGRDPEVTATMQRAEELSVLQLVETILQQSDALPCAIINQASDVIYIHGRTGKYLEPAEGRASVNIVEMARPRLRKTLAAAVRQVITQKRDVVCKGLTMDYDEAKFSLTVTVKPILENIAMRGLMMVVFEERSIPAQREAARAGATTKTTKRKNLDQLKQDLRHTRESLETTIEELEISNEELKSINEELQSTNEELQSTNEELETSKEELQSLNEESVTVNAELQARIDELTHANDDMKNLLDSTEIATIFLDEDMRIRRFTPSATNIAPLTSADCGRPINHLASRLINIDIAQYGRRVLADLTMREAEARSDDGCIYTMRVRPYRTVSNVIQGVVITFEDMTDRNRQQQAVRDSEERFRQVFELANDSLVLIDPEQGCFVEFNRNAHERLGYTRKVFEKLAIEDVEAGESAQDVADRFARYVRQGGATYEARHKAKDGGSRDVLVKMKVIAIGKKTFLLAVWSDIERGESGK